MPSEKLLLNGNKDSRFNARWIETSDLDELKIWIGTPNRILEKYSYKKKRIGQDWFPSGLLAKRNSKKIINKSLSKLSPEEKQKLLKLTRDYVYNDSTLLVKYKLFIEEYWRHFHIPIWWFNTIYVSSGAVLEISPGNNGILAAYSISIEEGGKLVMTKSMTLDVSIVKKI